MAYTMLIKYTPLFLLALLATYIPQAHAMESKSLECFGFVEVSDNTDDEPSEQVLADAIPECCHVALNRKAVPVSTTKIVTINLPKRTPKPTRNINNQELLTSINNLLSSQTNSAIEDTEKALAQFSKLINKQFPGSRILNSSSGELFHILYRGCGCDQLAMNLVFGSAGGDVINYDIGRPSEEEVKSQVAERNRLPEFTNSKSVASRFGTNNFCVAFKINSKYLTPGSGTENGFVTYNSAPVEVIAITHGRRI